MNSSCRDYSGERLDLSDEEMWEENLMEVAPALRPDQVGYWNSVNLLHKQSADDFYIELIGKAKDTKGAMAAKESFFKPRHSMIDLGSGQGISSIIEEEKNHEFEDPKTASEEGSGLRNSVANQSFSSYQTS